MHACIIRDNIITGNYYGVSLTGSLNSTFSNNIITLNTVGIQDQTRGWDCDVWTMNADGTNQVRLTDSYMWDDGPEWYPHDSKILYERVSNPFVGYESFDIWVMNVNGTDKTQLTRDSQQNMLGGWSPDASLIVYSSKRSGNLDIWVMNADRTNHRRLTTDPAFDSMPTWSPDGTRIVFISNRTGNQDMWIMNADGTNQTQLTSGIPSVMGGTWSPDNSQITFHSIEGEWNGNWDIWVINSDGTNAHKHACMHRKSNAPLFDRTFFFACCCFWKGRGLIWSYRGFFALLTLSTVVSDVLGLHCEGAKHEVSYCKFIHQMY